MGLLSNMIKQSQLKEGDHIYCYRRAHTYSHHGIYMGDDRVIHFTRTKTKKVSLIRTVFGRQPCEKCGYNPNEENGVVQTCLTCFLKHHRLFRFEYNAGFSERILKKSGTCSAVSSDMAKKVTERAKDMLNSDNQFGEYHLIDNNCECFAFYCTTGLRRTMQGNAFKDAIESVYKTLMSGEHHSLKDISESLLRGFIEKKIRRVIDERDRPRSEITNNDDDHDDDDGSDQDRSD
ncbi:protein LEAD-SENSITIVE 1 [Cannabis sativa]|uniref:protein LEAD-SENSITIVE 1 n=1 Tax=Cannabis sativa TaxID=3483 RepID=UPI0029CA0E68|nr:protein LEAD-SENSITIVE 1 [Cannabis sativa]